MLTDIGLLPSVAVSLCELEGLSRCPKSGQRSVFLPEVCSLVKLCCDLHEIPLQM